MIGISKVNLERKNVDLTIKKINRRKFIKSTALLGGISATSSLISCDNEPEDIYFKSQWHKMSDRSWIGAEYWANPMQDWSIKNGLLICKSVGPLRDLHHLTHSLGAKKGSFKLSVKIGCSENPLNEGKGSAGFRIALQGPLHEYRNNLIYGEGIDAGFSKEGFIFIGQEKQNLTLPSDAIQLVLEGTPSNVSYNLILSAVNAESGDIIGVVTNDQIAESEIHGNVAVATNFSSLHGNPDDMNKHNWPASPERPDLFDKFWFSDWTISGSKIAINENRAFGPILFNQFTVSRSILKMTIQMPPVGADDSKVLKLQTRSKQNDREWRDRAETTFDDHAYCGTFRIENWDDTIDTDYRILYSFLNKGGLAKDYYYAGTIPKDPIEKETIKVADVSCNHHDAFPNFHLTQNVKILKPDLIAIVGDQYYENSGGYGNATHLNPDGSIKQNDLNDVLLDSMRKWMMHGWTWRHLTKDIPSLCLPDDHDVYHGNLWGEGGKMSGNIDYEADRINFYDGSTAGYKMMLPWLLAIHKQQTSHHPDAYDPTPTGDGIPNYYGDYLFGRISFAVLADRQHKSGPASVMPVDHPGRKDHIYDADFDLNSIDDPSLHLLGDKQEEFLEKWTADWKDADIKAVISQTIFTAMATVHGPERLEVRADMDTNAWPQNKRNKAVKIMQKAFPVHIAGDQHLPALIQYGTDNHRDGPYAFSGPAVNVGYPRWFEPKEEGQNRAPGAPRNTGDFKDSFDHNLTVYAVGSSPPQPRENVIEFMQDKMSGIGLISFDKTAQKITFECWPFQADPRDKSKQMAGWPVEVDILDNFAPKSKFFLPLLKINGLMRPVFKVIDETTNETVYTIRRQQSDFQPFTLKEGKHRVEISDGDQVIKTLTGLAATKTNDNILKVEIQGEANLSKS